MGNHLHVLNFIVHSSDLKGGMALRTFLSGYVNFISIYIFIKLNSFLVLLIKKIFDFFTIFGYFICMICQSILPHSFRREVRFDRQFKIGAESLCK